MDDGVDHCSSVFGLVVCASSILGCLSTSPKPLLVPKNIYHYYSRGQNGWII
jgi:hypothetical protein